MRIQSCLRACLAAAVCVTAGLPNANADDAPGIVRMTDFQPTQIEQTAFLGETSTSVAADCGASDCVEGEGCQVVDDCCDSGGCDSGGCDSGGCDSGVCESCKSCPCGCCGAHSGTAFSCILRMFGCSTKRCTCDYCEYSGKGTGHCDQGSGLFGHYQITYANQPSYADARDGQAWAAPGYGMPITIPTAPVVRYSYNYSHGTPASRLTPLSTYNSATSPQPLFLQSW
jgi:hypothetical protein